MNAQQIVLNFKISKRNLETTIDLINLQIIEKSLKNGGKYSHDFIKFKSTLLIV